MVNIRNKIVMKDINKLVSYDKNNKKHPDEQISLLVQNIDKFGFTSPFLISKDNSIIAGHGRKLACERLGIKKIPCIIIDDLSEDEIKALRISDNRLGELGETNWDFLKEEYLELKDSGLDFLTGYGDEDFEFMAEDVEVEEDDFEAPADVEEIETDIKLGDVIQLGRHRLMCGDSTSEDVIKLINDKKGLIDLVVTDPPYNVDYQGSNGLKIQNDNMSDNSFYNFLNLSMEKYFYSLKEGGGIYVFHADMEGINFRKAFKDFFKLSSVCIWMKPSLVLGRCDYHWQHEPVLYGWKEGETHNWLTDRKQTTIWQFEKTCHNKEHPTMKPISLISYPIQNSSREGETVLDLFGGSGSTLIACEQLNRKCYMMELDPKYCEVICKRWEKLTGKTREVLDE